MAGLFFFYTFFFLHFSAVLLFILFFERVIFVEEDFLRERFAQAFKDWAEKTPMMIPSFKNRQRTALPFSLKTVLKREHSTFFLVIGAFTCMKVFGDFCYTGKWQIGWFYRVLFCFGLVVYIVLLILKKKHT